MRSLLIVLLAAIAAPVHAASFDCARAAAPDERAVCADPRLSDLDTALRVANAQARATTDPADAPSLAIVARGILADRRACAASIPRPRRAWLILAEARPILDRLRPGGSGHRGRVLRDG